MSKQTRRLLYSFRGSCNPPVVASRDNGFFCQKITKTAGTPTIRSGSGGAMELALDSAAEIQNLCFYQGDVLPFGIDDLLKIEIIAKLSGTLNGAITGAFGLTSARDDVLANMSQAALFRFAGGSANSLVLDARDGTNNSAGIATGEVPGNAYRRYAIDFCTGVKSATPPTLPKGGKAQLGFMMSDINGNMKTVGRINNFDMSAYSGNLQLLAQIQKTANAATGTLSILEIAVDYRLPV